MTLCYNAESIFLSFSIVCPIWFFSFDILYTVHIYIYIYLLEFATVDIWHA